ncbi:hypothetical protein OTU49_001354 [Cherax quadricarinatus]|uniref:Large ribosomal subunit protein uL23m n=1 Tax=Cherax quadricarinatus TaxID=27406 RepID=A0AAW0XUH4_CHEQU|nr:39S ribosomal protein L23, mitochondrial-like [Cherax quadricarinatus]
MSSRLYPIYQQGNPQLRIFLPNFFMKLVKPSDPQPPNVVQFIVPVQMTRYDIKNYLEKIYSVPVENIVTHVRMGKFERNFKGYIIKKDDYKVAYVTLPRTEKFVFPDLFPENKQKEADKELEKIDTLKAEWDASIKRHKHRQGVPTWFGL